MSDLNKLERWIKKIEEAARALGLSCYPQEFQIVSKSQMLEGLAYHGGYPLYPHWSFGKKLKIGKILYGSNYYFLPYEVVINTNPCRAFLLGTNPLIYNLLIAAHVLAHNDFFKNNRAFKNSRPEQILDDLTGYRLKIKKYVADSKIGPVRLENLIDAGHAIMFLPANVDFFEFLMTNAQGLKPWEKGVLEAIKTLNNHLMPNIYTKIMNEGWATYWHYQIIEELKDSLSFNDYFEAQEFHERVIRMPKKLNEINPYRVGFLLWKKIEKELGGEVFFKIRKEMTDLEFLLTYFNNRDDFIYENFIKAFQIDAGDDKILSLEERRELAKNYQKLVISSRGENALPQFRISFITKRGRNRLYLEHQHDGRSLDVAELSETLKLIQQYIWRNQVVLTTKFIEKDGKENLIRFFCNDGRISSQKLN